MNYNNHHQFLPADKFPEKTHSHAPLLITNGPIEKTPEPSSTHRREYLFEPNRETVFNALLDRYIRYTIYQAAIENATSEEAARMMAMKNATDNANKIIDTLQLSANKARQAQITTELSEIIGGSEAIN